MKEICKYIYCVVDCEQEQIFSSKNIGKTPAKVYSVHYKNIGAVISDSPIVKYSFISDNYLAHQRVIEEAMFENLTPLPVRFSTIAKDEESIRTILKKRYDEFKKNLIKMKGKRELGLKVFWDGDIGYKELLEQNANIRKMKDEIASLPSEKTYFQRIEIGNMVEKALQNKRDREAEEILNAFKDYCIDYKVNKIIGDKMIVNNSFLVGENQEKYFDERVQQLGKNNGGRLKINYVGPIPPFNFIEIIINLNELGLN